MLNEVLSGLLAVARFLPGAQAPQAKGAEVAHVVVRGKPVTVYQVATITAPGTRRGMDGFAIQVAYWLHRWTRIHGVEATANLCHRPDRKVWGARVLTIYSHTSSPQTNACPPGMVDSGTAIHSHPQRRRYPVNRVDRLFLHDGLMAHGEIAMWPERFSPDDLAKGPGYLVGAVGIYYQDGHGHVRTVWSIRQPDPMPAAHVVISKRKTAVPDSLPPRGVHHGVNPKPGRSTSARSHPFSGGRAGSSGITPFGSGRDLPVKHACSVFCRARHVKRAPLVAESA